MARHGVATFASTTCRFGDALTATPGRRASMRRAVVVTDSSRASRAPLQVLLACPDRLFSSSVSCTAWRWSADDGATRCTPSPTTLPVRREPPATNADSALAAGSTDARPREEGEPVACERGCVELSRVSTPIPARRSSRSRGRRSVESRPPRQARPPMAPQRHPSSRPPAR